MRCTVKIAAGLNVATYFAALQTGRLMLKLNAPITRRRQFRNLPMKSARLWMSGCSQYGMVVAPDSSTFRTFRCQPFC